MELKLPNLLLVRTRDKNRAPHSCIVSCIQKQQRESGLMTMKKALTIIMISMFIYLCGCVEIDEIDMNFKINNRLEVFQVHTIRGFRPSSTFGPNKDKRTDGQIKKMMDDFYNGCFNKNEYGIRRELHDKGISLDMYSATLINTTETRCDVRIQADKLPITSLMPLYLRTTNYTIESTDNHLSIRIHPPSSDMIKKRQETRVNVSISYDGTVSEHNGTDKKKNPHTIQWTYNDLITKGIYFVLEKTEE